MTLPELTPLQAPAAPPVVLEPGGDRIAHARQVLHSVPDPEVPAVSLYDLGIVRDVRLLENGVLDVVLTPTYSGCPATEVIESDVLAAISAAGLGPAAGAVAGVRHRLGLLPGCGAPRPAIPVRPA